MMSPRISIVTPSFNQGQYIEQTIDSVLSQGYPNLEYIVIDGGSTDDTIRILKKYERHLDYWVSEKDKGQSHAINKGLQRTTGEILAYLNSDDYYLPGAFSTVADLYRENAGAGLLHGRCRYVDAVGNRTGSQYGRFDTAAEILDIHRVWWAQRQVVQPEVFWTRAAYHAVGDFRQDLHYVMDYDYWLRILLAGFRVARVDQEFTAFRFQENQKSNQSAEVAVELLTLIQPYLWDPATPLTPLHRIRRQGEWVYATKLLSTVELSIERGDSRLQRWKQVASLLAHYPQLTLTKAFWNRMQAVFGRRMYSAR